LHDFPHAAKDGVMSLINSLENRFGRHAIPGLVAILAWFQVAVWVLIKIRPEFAGALTLDRAQVLDGQMWRVLTWVFIPGADNPLFLFFAVMLMLMFSEALDRAWGPFRVNLYVWGGVLAMILGAMIFQRPHEVAFWSGLTLYTSIFLAFAVVAPNFEILVFFILPVKMKWLAAITGALLLLSFLGTPQMRLPIVFSLLNFFITFGPGFFRWLRQRGTVVERRARFDSAKAPEGAWLHKCHACGKTDLDDPKLDFRVGADGEDYCSVCRPRKPSTT
jgi:hypothetical protein